jgi:ABC-type multidrug transport system fused ATPase/permease subunit
MVALLIIGLLSAVDVRLALTIGLVLGGAYVTVFVFLRRKQRRLGRERVLQNGLRYQMAGEALAGIKELKVLGRERGFLQRFKKPSWLFCRASASNQVVSSLPKYALETIAFSGILLIILYSLRFYEDVGAMLPVLSLYAFAGYRLMPSLNEVFAAAIQIRFNRVALEDLHQDLQDSIRDSEGLPATRAESAAERVSLRNEIRLYDVGYLYPGASAWSLQSISMRIGRNQIVGIVGETGAGKTTLVDVLLGLLECTQGRIEVDGVPLHADHRLLWRRSCGYIPQEIFLSDDSVRANIAFGVSPDLIDDEAVRRSAAIAQIDRFLDTLPEGYQTRIGERGVRLSGGQRQRIGIARALYHDPDVLVMDEATSSLDGATEAAVMEMIHRLGRSKTLIVIAHRLSTVKACDVIHLLQAGRLVASGTYEELSQSNQYFRTMAGLEHVLAG